MKAMRIVGPGLVQVTVTNWNGGQGYVCDYYGGVYGAQLAQQIHARLRARAVTRRKQRRAW